MYANLRTVIFTFTLIFLKQRAKRLQKDCKKGKDQKQPLPFHPKIKI